MSKRRLSNDGQGTQGHVKKSDSYQSNKRRKKKYNQSGNGCAVGLERKEWEAVADIADMSDETMTIVATRLIRFAMKHIEWE